MNTLLDSGMRMPVEDREFILDNARELIEQQVDLIQVVAPDGGFLYVNSAWRRELGWSDADAALLNFLDIIHPEHQQPWREIYRNVLKGQRLDNFEMVLVSKDGRHLPVDGSVWCWMRNDKPLGVCAVFRDSAARAIGEQRVSRVLYKDELTGLFNARGFSVRSAPFVELMADKVDRIRGWVAYLEIDNLDEIQRRHGDKGVQDAVKRTADVLNRALRGHDIIARMTDGGFAALVTLPIKYQPSYVLTRVRGALALANRHASNELPVEVAIGAADVDPCAGIDHALKRAKDLAGQNSSKAKKHY